MWFVEEAGVWLTLGVVRDETWLVKGAQKGNSLVVGREVYLGTGLQLLGIMS